MTEDGPWKHPDDMRKLNGLLRISDGNRQRGWSIDTLGYAAHWNSTDQVPLALIQSGALCRFCALDPTDGGRTARTILTGEWHQQDADGYLKVSAFAEHYRLQLWSNFTYFEDDPQRGDQFNQRDARNLFGSRVAKGRNHTLFGHDSVTEVGAQRELTPHVALSLDVLNLFDRRYYDIAYDQDYQVSPTRPLVADGITVHPGEPREFRLTLRMTL